MGALSLQEFRAVWGSEQPGLREGALACGTGWNEIISEVPSHPNHFMAPVFH